MDRERREEERAGQVQLSAFEARERRLRSKERYQEIRRIAVVSDIHGNLEALEAVAADIRTQDCQSIVCLGNTVGYGANPVECLEWVKDNADVSVLGEYDALILGLGRLCYLMAYSRETLLWTRKVLPFKLINYLSSLPVVAFYQDATFVHGQLYNPEDFKYISDSDDAYLTMQLQESLVSFCGNTHIPRSLFCEEKDGEILIGVSSDARYSLKNHSRHLINVGSVGRPKDENSKAAYAIFDRRAQDVEIRRVVYDIEVAAEKIVAAGLPSHIGDRLRLGR